VLPSQIARRAPPELGLKQERHYTVKPNRFLLLIGKCRKFLAGYEIAVVGELEVD
jgi:hypothetical protein